MFDVPYITELLTAAEELDFSDCNMRHENIQRNKQGKAIATSKGKAKYVAECSVAKQRNRPCCAHCREQDTSEKLISEDVLLEMHEVLQTLGLSTPQLDAMRTQYEQDVSQLPDLDEEMRIARTGSKDPQDPENVPSVEEVQTAEEPLLREHRAINRRMEAFRDAMRVITDIQL